MNGFDRLHELLPGAILGPGGKEMITKCPFCGDSKKHSNKKGGHLYISTNAPFMYHCFLCDAGGVVGKELLGAFGITDNFVVTDVTKQVAEWKKNNIQAVRLPKKWRYTLSSIPDTDELIKHTKVSAKTQYFNNRFGTDLTPEEIQNSYRAVFSLRRFMQANRLYWKGDKRQTMIDRDYIGFISSDGCYIIFRDITGQHELRYYNFQIGGQNGSKNYNIPTAIDTLNPKARLVLAEGVFDIIGVKTAFGLSERYTSIEPDTNIIYSAVCGKSYASVIYEYAKKGMLDLSVDIYSDADVGLSKYREMKNDCFVLRDAKMRVYYNTIGKDYGVPASGIELKFYDI